ncbi:MAG: ATP-dependent DNA helicase RecG [Sphingomonadales bacterium]
MKMRPEILFPLFAPATRLKGVGDKLAPAFERMTGGGRVIDLLWHLPHGLIDRRPLAAIADIRPGLVATLRLRVVEHDRPSNPRSPYRVVMTDDAGDSLTLVYFSARGDYLKRLLPEGAVRVISGQVDYFGGRPQIAHPDYVVAPEQADSIPSYEAVYPLTHGISNKRVRQWLAGALQPLPELPEWIDPSVVAQQDWPAWHQAVLAAHHPQSAGDIDPSHPARRRLGYDEFFANQLALALVRDRVRRRSGRAVAGDGAKRAAMRAALPFKPTGAQAAAMADVAADMASDQAMLRLLQGDVGSGKTLVAVDAMLNAVEAGGQAALLAPTEILARQHAVTVADMTAPAGARVALLTGRDKGAKRQQILTALRDGEIDILIGTHALFQEQVAFHNLLLAVIDEQHRFGVHQRLSLTKKGDGRLDVLVMTATPIPRTLTLACYGEMDVSRLHEKPPGRTPIDTRVVSLERLEEVINGLRRALARGERAYWVCPLVEDSDKADLAAAEARHAHLQQIFGDQVGLVHGRMKAADKDAVMADFVAGRIAVLVATTVIEVGVDVPEATIMVIEQAEQFGLAQLHQLRGRVGRGHAKSVCLLLRGADLGETARARLAIMRETDDGFRIAEEDLRLRGAGELLGTRQSGLPSFRLADIAAHGDLLAVAQKDARLMVERDRQLQSPRGQACRTLLYLFERDAAVRLLQSG